MNKLLQVTKDDIEKFLKDNYRKMVNPEFYFGADNNQDPIEKFTKDNLKVLICFFSTGETRVLSNTYNALNHLFHEKYGDNVFVDYCFFPEQNNVEIFRKSNIPFIFGNVSHQPAMEYDLLVFSTAIITEAINVPHMLHGSGIPLTIEQRREVKGLPLILWGGAAANEISIITGPIYDKNGNRIGKSLIDMALYGYGEINIPELTSFMYESKKKGIDIKDHYNFTEYLIDSKCLTYFLYFPDRYEFIYEDDKFTIKEIKRLDDRLPDRVLYNRIYHTDFRGWSTKAFHLQGGNSDNGEIMISSGCTGQNSACSFSFMRGTKLYTSNGILSIEDVFDSGIPTGAPDDNVVRAEIDMGIQGISGAEHSRLVYSVGTKPCIRINTKSGYHLDITNDHNSLVVRNGEFIKIPAGDIKPGDYVLITKSNLFSRVERTLAQAEFMGYMVGSGAYRKSLVLYAHNDRLDEYRDILNNARINYLEEEGVTGFKEFILNDDLRQVFDFPKYNPSKRVPLEVYQYSEEQLRAFFQGFISALGEVTNNKSSVVISNRNKALMEDIKLLLLSIGIKTYTVQSLRKDNVSITKLFINDYQSLEEVKSLDLHNNLLKKELEDVKAIRRTRWEICPANITEYIHSEYKHFVDTVSDIQDLGIQPIYDITVEPTHTVVANGITTFQCMEGITAGHYREKDLKQVEEDMKYSVRDCAPNTMSWFSYNVNYYGQFMDLLGTSLKYFKNLTLINERLDIIAHSPDQLAIAKKLGLKRFSGAIEGMNDRVRNNIFNKNLDKETLMKAVNIILDQKMMKLKFGLITYGGETESDMRDFVRDMDEIIAVRDSKGSNCSFQINCCLTKEALTPVLGRGLLRQNKLLSEQSIDAGDRTKITKSKSNGISDIVKITLSTGQEIRGTYNHPVLLAGKNYYNDQQFTYMANLNKFDKIQVKINSQCFGLDRDVIIKDSDDSYIIKLNPHFYRFLALVLQKGWVSNDTISISERRTYFEDIIKFLPISYRVHKIPEAYNKEVIVIESGSYYLYLRQNNIYGNDWKQMVPDIVLTSSKESQLEFIRTLFRLNHKEHSLSPYTKLYHSSTQFLRDVQVMLLNIGIVSNIRDDSYLQVLPEMYKRFSDIIGSDININYDIKPTLDINNDIINLEVVDIDYLQAKEETYAITTKNGRYLTNGIISHNTPLVLYSMIPLRYFERVTARNSYNKARTMTLLIEEMRKRNIRFKINGKGCGTWLEQLILDFGPAGTDTLVDVAINKDLFFYGFFGDKARDIVTQSLKERGYEPLFFIKERPLDWIFPNDHINYATPQMIKKWKERFEKKDFETPMCLKTLAHMKPKCGSCGVCKTPEDLKQMLRRVVKDDMTSDEIIAQMSDNRHTYSVRVIVQVNRGWEMYEKDALAHYLTAQFLKQDERLANAFYGVGKTNLFWTSNNGQKGWFGGKFVFDWELKERIPDSYITQEMIDNINSKLKVAKIISIIPDTKMLPVQVSHKTSFIGATSVYSMSQIKDKLSMFNWDIKIPLKSMGTQLDTKVEHMPELKDSILLTQSSNGVLIYMSLKNTISPYMVMASILNKGYQSILNDFRFDSFDTGADIQAECRCGKQLQHSLITDKVAKECPICTGKKILYALSHR